MRRRDTKLTDADGDTVTTYVYVGTTSTPTTVETSTTGTTANLGNTVVLNDGAIYYYRLRSWDGYEWSDYTTADKFSMHTPPGTPRIPISIQNDTYFNPENGVNGGGSGTAGDPYIIENWAIGASSANGIRIKNTTKYFIVRNCLVENGGVTYYGIYLDNVINGRIENNKCDKNGEGIRLSSSSYNNLINNTCSNNSYGIYLDGSSNNILSNNSCKNGGGIKLIFSTHNNLTNNTCENNNCGIYLGEAYFLNPSNYNILDNNTCSNGRRAPNYSYGISLYDSFNNTLSNNSCRNNDFGISLDWSDNNLIFGNILTNNTMFNAYDLGTNYWSD